MIKKVTAIALALSILVSGAAYAEKKEVIEVTEQTNYSISFEDEKEWLEELGVSEADTLKLELLYNELIALEENDKEEEAEAKWNEIDVIIENYYAEEDYYFTFEDEKKWFKEIGVSAVDMVELETLFKEVIALEENGKDTEAESKWTEFDIILGNYFDEEDEVFTFEDEKEWLEELGVSEADTLKLELLYNEIIILEENDKEDETEAKWNEIDVILENYYAEDDYDFTFEDEKEWLIELEVNETDMAKLEALYNEAIKLEEDNNETEADKKWQLFDEIMNKYFEE